MENKIFKLTPLRSQSFAQWVFRQPVEENAIISLNNLLATKKITEITDSEIAVIDAQFGTAITSDFILNLEEFYAVYLNNCLADQRLELDELADLRHLKKLFGLPDHVIENLHRKIGGAVYRQTFEAAVADGELTKEEKAFIQDLEETLRLPKELSEKISGEVREGFMAMKLEAASRDQRLSPGEEKELKTIAASLGIAVSGNSASSAQLQRMKVFWALENLELPTARAPIPLGKGEICHYASEPAKWKRISGRNWSAPRSAARVSDGNEMTIAVAYGGRYLEPVDEGNVYLTNRRVVLEGENNRVAIKLEKILRVKAYRDGLEIVRESGKNPILSCEDSAEVAILLNRLLQSTAF